MTDGPVTPGQRTAEGVRPEPSPPRCYRILLAGVGGDAHSVGLTVLRQGLQREGYAVTYLGVQQSVADVCDSARSADVVMISNMDGHALYYMEQLPHEQRRTGTADRLWYLGGYPALTNDEETLTQLAGQGFDRVFHGYVNARSVFDVLASDLAGRPPRQHPPALPAAAPPTARLPQLTPEEVRAEVLSSWWSGDAARDRAANAGRMLQCAGLAGRQAAARRDGTLLIQPRTGVSDHRGQRMLFRAMSEAGADVLSFQIDSLTRNNRYDEIDQILKRHKGVAELASVLNGYPAVNLGMEAMAELAAQFRHLPVQVRHSTRDPRLLAELTFGAGISAYEGGPISYNLPYYRDFPIGHALDRWRYVDQLAGSYFRDYGVVIDREFFGVLTACLVPPCVAAAVNVFEALLAAEAGVKSVSLGYAEQGHRAQDLAAVRAMERLARRYLDAAGHEDTMACAVWHQFMGPFPQSAKKSRQMLVGSAISALHSGAVRLLLKTHAEARHIPKLEDNRSSLELVRSVCASGRSADAELSSADRMEEDLIMAEAGAILDRALAAADGDAAGAIQTAVSSGWLDIPFSPSRWNAGKVLPLRDCTGAVRLASAGNLPLPAAVREFHRDAAVARFARDGDNLGELIEEDMRITADGRFDCWPFG